MGGEVIAIYRNGARVGEAELNDLKFSFQDSGLTAGTHAYEARVEDKAGGTRSSSGIFTLTVATQAPSARTVEVRAAVDDAGARVGELTSGGSTDDNTPMIKGSVSAPLESGEVIAIFRDGALIGTATINGSEWLYQDGDVRLGAHSYQARVIDSTGTVRATSEVFTLELTPSVLQGLAEGDSVAGSKASEKIWGIPISGTALGRGTIDRLNGGEGTDIFVLGDSRGRFYDDGRGKTAGTTDYAIIEDFDASDQIQLFGSRHEYHFSKTNLDGFSGLGIYHDSNGNGVLDSRDELIGILAGTYGIEAGQLVFL
jgi:hypothetical protein